MDHDLVYVSRRLGDADPESERLIEHLRAYFTPDRLVMADPATGGRDPGARMESCAIVIAVIDLPWLRHLDWLKRGDDLVHAEIDWAIRHGRPVLPVIVGDVSLPEPEDVPLNLHPMFMHRRLHLDDTTEAEIQSRLLGPLEDLIASPEERAHWYDPPQEAMMERMEPESSGAAPDEEPGPGAPVASQLPQEVEGRVFARERLKPARRSLVRFFLHLSDQRDEVRRLAEAADPRAAERTATTLSQTLKDGDRVRVALTAELGQVTEPVQEKTWRGKPLPFDFALTAPEAGFDEFFADIGVYLNETPIGRLGWTFLEETGAARPDADGAAEQATLTRYRDAFVSYSSKDRVEVLKRVQGLRAAGVEVFMDLLDLTPGDRYAELLATKARGSDLFVLFWSQNAAASEWVVKEALWAIEHQKSSPDHRPDLRPIILDGPPPAKPPPELKSAIHMNDLINYVIAAEEAARRPQ